MDNSLVLAIRAAGLEPAAELRLVEQIEEYGRRCHGDGYRAGYAEGIEVANSDRP